MMRKASKNLPKNSRSFSQKPQKPRPLSAEFFARPTLDVARDLLGKFLVTPERSAMITEVEAYDGPSDLACHAARGRTTRTEVMYSKGGVWYVYLCYGVHWMVNVVTGPRDYPAAVLIRGVDGVSGPGRVTKFFTITKEHNTKLSQRSSGLWVEDRGVIVPGRSILRTPRIGIDYAGPVWSKKPYRFLLN